MYLRVGRSMAVASMAMALRSASGFVGPVRTTTAARQSAAGGVRSWMSASGVQKRQQQPSSSSVPTLDVQAAELKAERLWGMADARKPVSVEPTLESRMERSSLAGAVANRETDGFIKAEGEVSALRRYQYSEQLAEDSDSGDDDGDDGNEYYI